MGKGYVLGVDGLDAFVELHLRMITSKQRFEWRWKGETTADGSFLRSYPSLLAFAGPDGMPLEEPKVWYKGSTRDIVQRGGKPFGWEEGDEEEVAVAEEEI